jgi:hypothetical protein
MRKIIVGLALAVGVSQSAHAWFFLFVPGLFGDKGDACVSPTARVGDTINKEGTRVVIKSLKGTSSRCSNANMPVLAESEPVTASTSASVAPSEVAPSAPAPMVQNSGPDVVIAPNHILEAHALRRIDIFNGSMIRYSVSYSTNPGGRARTVDADCEKGMRQEASEPWTRLQEGTTFYKEVATACSMAGYANPRPTESVSEQLQPMEPSEATRTSQAPATSASGPAMVTVQSQSARKLRELNGLLKDGIITPAEYEVKKKEILRTF